jgi:large subunit ribosomal protein L31
MCATESCGDLNRALIAVFQCPNLSIPAH